jgi:hypothetical protein
MLLRESTCRKAGAKIEIIYPSKCKSKLIRMYAWNLVYIDESEGIGAAIFISGLKRMFLD